MVCSNADSCLSSSIYCPYREENACSITCASWTDSCSSMQIYVPDGYIWGYLDIHCEGTNSCNNIGLNCQGGGKLDTTYSYSGCTDAKVGYCCPYYNVSDDIGDCISDQDCFINCTSTECINKVIDGSKAKSLTVFCGAHDCKYLTINCPLGECLLSCIGYASCRYLIVRYDGTSQNNAKLDIICYGYRGCDVMWIQSDWINEIEWNCTSTALDSSDFTCDAVLNANYANKVTINTNERCASYYSTWNVMYAKQVLINSRGSDGSTISMPIENTVLRADYVKSLVINLASDSGDSRDGQITGDWYISSNTTINCYGYGCWEMYNLQRDDSTTAEGLDINVYGCGVCFSIADCIYDLDIYCDGGSDHYKTNLCSTSKDNECGCRDIINNTFTEFNSTIMDNLNCYGTMSPTFDPTTDPTGITSAPTMYPTINASTSVPTTTVPTTSAPTTMLPTTMIPFIPTTDIPTTNVPSKDPTMYPTLEPTFKPTDKVFTSKPITDPTDLLSHPPTETPSAFPTVENRSGCLELVLLTAFALVYFMVLFV